MTILGITGGIGSGKSIVCKVLSFFNIPIYDADKEAKILNDISPTIRHKLTEYFGEDIYKSNILDKKLLASYIFNNKDDLAYVNSVIHTELSKHFLEWIDVNKDYDTIAIDAAVLFEAGFQKYVDKIITVVAPIDVRIDRVSKRDNLSNEQIISRINSQMSDEQRTSLSDYVVINDEQQSIIKQINNIVKSISNTF